MNEAEFPLLNLQNANFCSAPDTLFFLESMLLLRLLQFVPSLFLHCNNDRCQGKDYLKMTMLTMVACCQTF